MKNANVLRTAAVATLATFALVTGVITSREEVVEAPMALVPVESSAAFKSLLESPEWRDLDARFDIADNLAVNLPANIAEIVYVDHYGNGMSSVRAADVAHSATVRVNGHTVLHAPVFAAVPDGAAFWYENSVGLLEIACNRASAAAKLGFAIGHPVAILDQ